MNLIQEPRKGYAFLLEGGTIDGVAHGLGAGIVKHVPSPMVVPKVRGAGKAFSFHWSNASAAWDVIVWKDFPAHLDGAEFILFTGRTALSPLDKPWSLAEMRYVATRLPPHPGYASSYEGGQARRAAEQVALRFVAGVLTSRVGKCLVPFPPEYQDNLRAQNKTVTLRISDEMGRYKEGDVCEAGSYTGEPWGIRIQVQEVSLLQAKNLVREGIPETDIAKVITERGGDSPVELIHFRVLGE